MAVWSIVKFSELGKSSRLDPEYYHPFFLDFINKQKEKPKLVEFIIFPNRKFYKEKGNIFDYIEISRVSTSVGLYNTIEIYEEDAPSRAQYIVEEGDILVSKVRPNRSAICMIRKLKRKTVCSSGFAVIRANNISKEYLFAFLKTRIITNLLYRETTASMYPAITDNDLKNLPFPIPRKEFENEIKNFVIEAFNKLDFSKSLLSTAESLLLSELGLDKLELPKTKWNIRNYSETEEEGRIDGEYFLPKYYALLKQIKNSKFGSAPLLSKVKHKSKMMKPREDKEYEYIELADVDQSIGTITEASKIIGAELPSRARMPLKARNVILSSVKGSIDKVAIIPEELNNAIGSTGFFVFEEKEYTSELLLVLLRLDILKEQFVREARGTILTATNQNSLSNIIVPEVPEPLMQEISDKVRESHSARKEAKKLLEEAKHKVEEMILEDDEKTV